MSLILEALRRSEAERQRGQAPDVLATVEVMRPAAATGLPAAARWGVAAMGLALVVGVAWWRWAPSPEPHAPVDDPTALEPAPAPATRADLPPASIAPTPAAPDATGPTVATPATAPTPVATPEPSTAPPSVTAAADIPPPALPATLTTAMPATPTPAPAPATLPQASEFTSPEATVRLAELSSEERQALPALKISMHMWAPEPADRFVIIDGARLAEGDRVADATISAIVADGVTLAWRGRQIRLPIR